MITLLLKMVRVLFGLALFALGSYLGIQANIGLGAWEAFGVGVSAATGLSYGDVIMLSGLLILIIDVLLKEKIGIGTVLNTLLIGKLVDLYAAVGLVQKLTHFMPGLLLLLTGQAVVCLGIYFYAGAGLGAGPRDSLMVALGKRLPRVPVGAIRGLIEGAVLLIGWAMGAKIGIGTVIAVFGIGIIMQATFHALRFDVKGVRHESVLHTARRLRGASG